MTGVSNINTAQRANIASPAELAKLSSNDTGESEIVAVIRAIPKQNRMEVLAALQALVCTPTTHTVKASFCA